MIFALDSNIVMDYLNGREAALVLVDSVMDKAVISTVTWIEVMTGAQTAYQKQEALRILNQLRLHETNTAIAEIAVKLRQKYRLRLPDAIIWATAKHLNACLLTRDTDYPAEALDIRVPYTL